MTKSSITLCIGLLIALVMGMFTYTFLKRQEINQTNAPVVAPSTATTTNSYGYVTSITTKHFYLDGVHTFVGSIDMPTPCDLLDSAVTIRESFPEQVVLEFRVINNTNDCAPIITPQRFKVAVVASVGAILSATFMDRPVQLNVIPAKRGEVPEDFEIFIKG